MKKRKLGILLILIGIGIPSVLFFFQDFGEFVLKEKELKMIKRPLTPEEHSSLMKLVDEDWVPRNSTRLSGMVDNSLRDQILNSTKLHEWSIYSGKEVIVPYKHVIGIGSIFVLIGLGLVIFSFFPPSKQPTKEDISNDQQT